MPHEYAEDFYTNLFGVFTLLSPRTWLPRTSKATNKALSKFINDPDSYVSNFLDKYPRQYSRSEKCESITAVAAEISHLHFIFSGESSGSIGWARTHATLMYEDLPAPVLRNMASKWSLAPDVWGVMQVTSGIEVLEFSQMNSLLVAQATMESFGSRR